ncbi:MAG: hypothetical protein H6Q42_3428 [Deltaproteobacteria bacterium]|nr:hypothetical protein [Deltaproteobacteria bacterium]
MSMFSMASSRVQSGLAIVASKGYRLMAVQHFREAGILRNIHDLETSLAERLGRSARGEDLHAEGRELPGEI